MPSGARQYKEANSYTYPEIKNKQRNTIPKQTPLPISHSRHLPPRCIRDFAMKPIITCPGQPDVRLLAQVSAVITAPQTPDAELVEQRGHARRLRHCFNEAIEIIQPFPVRA